MEPGTCALCNEDTLLTESHIISKFVWKASGLIGKQKKYSIICHSDPTLTERNLQDGLKERLCCQPCEDKMNRWETESRKVLFGETSPFRAQRPETGTYFIDGVDYRSFKLFQLAILWRMGASRLPFFQEVKLGIHQERLRRMVYDEIPGEPWRYGCLVSVLTYQSRLLPALFTSPVQGVFNGHHAYSLSIGSVHLAFEVASKRNPKLPDGLFFAPHVTWVVPCRDVSDYPHLLAAHEARIR